MNVFSSFRYAVLGFAVLALTSGAAKADMPVAIIDLSKIIETSAAGKDLQAKFKTRRDSLQKEAVAYEKDLRSKEQALLDSRKTLDEKGFNEKKKTFETDLKSKRESVMKKNMDLEKAKNEALKGIQGNVAKICADIAEQKKIQAVLDRSAVVIAQESLDITADVIKKLDETMKTVDLK